MSQSNGGISQGSRISAYPMVTVVTGIGGLYTFDPTLGLNDMNNPVNYFFKVEEISPGTTPTISKVIVVYRDLGLVTVTFTLTGTNDDQKIVSNSVKVTLGNANATGRIMTRNDIGLTLTGQNLQLSINRAPGAGNLALIKLVLVGTVESS
jgi:hypothetical protein